MISSDQTKTISGIVNNGGTTEALPIDAGVTLTGVTRSGLETSSAAGNGGNRGVTPLAPTSGLSVSASAEQTSQAPNQNIASTSAIAPDVINQTGSNVLFHNPYGLGHTPSANIFARIRLAAVFIALQTIFSQGHSATLLTKIRAPMQADFRTISINGSPDLHSNEGNPEIRGTASGINVVQVKVINLHDRPVYVSDPVSVDNGVWAVKINPPISFGRYRVRVTDVEGHPLASANLFILGY